LAVNHGGGYQYRDFRKEEDGDDGGAGLMEECFERQRFPPGFY